MQRGFFQICTVLALLSSCGPATVSPSLSPILPLPATTLSTMLPTEIATSSPTLEMVSPPPETTPILEGTFTLEPTITETLPPFPTLTPSPTLEPTNKPQPVAGSSVIQLSIPGPLSKLVSQVGVYGSAIPGYGNLGRIFLYGEDGRLLDSELLQLNTKYIWAYFLWTLDFEIQGAGELGRLTMTTKDEYGRFNAVYSVHLLLLTEGFSVINPPGDFKERAIIEQPGPGDRIAGGKLPVSGEMRPFSSAPLVVELIDRARNVLAVQEVAITPAPDDIYVPFQVDLPYSITTGTWALLVVRQPDDRIDGTMYLFSQEVYLNP